MRLKVITPTSLVVNREVVRIIGEAPEGSFGILPRHADYVSPLRPGILIYQESEGDHERFVGVNEGTLVKCGEEVLVSTRDAVEGDSLETLRNQVEEVFLKLDEHERMARTALARLEAGIVRRMIDLDQIE